jgi:Y_Y_Y domain
VEIEGADSYISATSSSPLERLTSTIVRRDISTNILHAPREFSSPRRPDRRKELVRDQSLAQLAVPEQPLCATSGLRFCRVLSRRTVWSLKSARRSARHSHTAVLTDGHVSHAADQLASPRARRRPAALGTAAADGVSPRARGRTEHGAGWFLRDGLQAGAALRYEYKLKGATADWSAPTAERSVNYANLAPGGYRFLVRSVSADGVHGDPPAAVSFTSLPPLWRQPWVLAAIALAVAAAAGVFARARYARIKALRESENRF